MSFSETTFSIRNFLSRTQSREEQTSKPPPSHTNCKPRESTTSTIFSTTCSPNDPFNAHPGEALLGETDFRVVSNSVLFGPKPKARVHRPIRQRRSRDSDDTPMKSSDCSPFRTREKASQPTKEYRPDPYHQYAYETRAGARSHSQPILASSRVWQDERSGEGRVDAGTQTQTQTQTQTISRNQWTGQANGASIPSQYLILPSFTDPLDRAIGTYNPSNPASSHPLSQPPVGILNSPYGMNGHVEEARDRNHPAYDTDWGERLFDPVPGAGVYAGELIHPGARPKDWNVVYFCMDWVLCDVVVRALPFNRRGMRIGFLDPGAQGMEIERRDIVLRKGFGKLGSWARNMEEEEEEEEASAWKVVKDLCRERLVGKAEWDYRRELRFEEEVRRFWERKG